MPSDKCPFSSLQAAAVARCPLAREVVRRGGSEYDCTQPASLQACGALARHLVAIGLPALGHEDDLTLTPKSVYDRALIGGLRGIHGLLGGGLPGGDAGADPLEDLWGLVSTMQAHLGGPEALPTPPLTEAMAACEAPRRRGRRR